jgi:hypothetical protein
MASCGGCGEKLDPAWKFCIHCGVPVVRPALSFPVFGWSLAAILLVIAAGALAVALTR